MAKKRMKTPIFMALWIAFAVILLALGIAFNLMATTFSNIFTSLFSWERGKSEAIPTEGTEDWDTNYYSYKAKSLDDATSNANKLVEEICDEGFVLLKNNKKDGNNVLPLDPETDKVAMFGRASVDPILGGSGSGNAGSAKVIVKPYDALTESDFNVNQDVYTFFNNNYTKYDKCAIAMDNYDGSTFFIGEIPTSAYTGFTPVSTETAIVFIGRGGGEGWDLSTNLKQAAQTSASKEKISKNTNTAAEVANYTDDQHQLELSKEEKDMIKYAKENYANTVVVINSSHAMELGPIADDSSEYSADAILWIGSTGAEGCRSLGNILSGNVNPSGRLSDIYAADFTADPTFKNEGIYEYSGIGENDIAAGNAGLKKAFAMQYEEGIYVGYKYYETAYAEALKGNYSGFDYDSAVVYPFGYGLSYSDFTQSIVSSDTSGDKVSVTVSVKNNSELAGKEVVQLYYTPPYTSGGIEKADVNLIAIGKVEVGANATEEITLTFNKEDLASYDYKKTKTENGGYVLEKGSYEITLRTDSHTLATGATKKISFTVNEDIIYDENNKRESDEVAAVNRFDNVSTMMKDTAQSGYARNFSRANFAETFPTTPTSADLDAVNIKVLAQQNGGTTVKAGLAEFKSATDPTLGNVSTSKIYAATAPEMNGTNGTKFSDLRGKDYEDTAWEQLLANIKDSEYVSATFNASAYNTAKIDSIAKPRTNDPDGPAGITSLFGSTGCCAYMSEVVLACTFNTELAERMGDAVAEEAYYYQKSADSSSGGTNGWYAPAMNIHRSPFAGRNFEYYSEDPNLSGFMGAAVVRGAAAKGVNCYIKHFALNDSEIYRTTNLCVWANEQTIRELYLRPFEMTIKNSEIEIKYIADKNGTMATKTIKGANGIMSSFNRIGTTWAGGSYALMTEVLRNEWGFDGLAISDFNLYGYTDADQGLRAGTDIQLAFGIQFEDEKSATAQNAMYKALHNMCYATVHTNIMQGVAPGATFKYYLAGWQKGLIALSIILYLATAGCVAWIIIRTIRVKKEKAAA